MVTRYYTTNWLGDVVHKTVMFKCVKSKDTVILHYYLRVSNVLNIY